MQIPKAQKGLTRHHCLFVLLLSAGVKATCKMLAKLIQAGLSGY